eukprot:scaffold175931_cov18-Tisochrysis_lutea.AAC.1
MAAVASSNSSTLVRFNTQRARQTCKSCIHMNNTYTIPAPQAHTRCLIYQAHLQAGTVTTYTPIHTYAHTHTRTSCFCPKEKFEPPWATGASRPPGSPATASLR